MAKSARASGDALSLGHKLGRFEPWRHAAGSQDSTTRAAQTPREWVRDGAVMFTRVGDWGCVSVLRGCTLARQAISCLAYFVPLSAPIPAAASRTRTAQSACGGADSLGRVPRDMNMLLQRCVPNTSSRPAQPSAPAARHGVLLREQRVFSRRVRTGAASVRDRGA